MSKGVGARACVRDRARSGTESRNSHLLLDELSSTPLPTAPPALPLLKWLALLTLPPGRCRNEPGPAAAAAADTLPPGRMLPTMAFKDLAWEERSALWSASSEPAPRAADPAAAAAAMRGEGPGGACAGPPPLALALPTSPGATKNGGGGGGRPGGEGAELYSWSAPELSNWDSSCVSS
jgi:hypothetical protein